MNRSFLLLALGALLLVGCKKDPAEEKAAAPKLVSTTPASGATGLKGSTLSLVITMDQNVKVSSSDAKRVTVSGEATVSSVAAYNESVTVKLEGLASGNSYTVTVPEGVIKGYKDNQNGAAAISVSFTMEEAEPEEDDYPRTPATSLTSPFPTAQAVKL